MKVLNIQIDDSLYPALLEILKFSASKIQIQEQSSDKDLGFEQTMNYTIDKNKELYTRLS